ncbi:unnamed protein product [Protopolystoma xenopodis]|uniref:Uncharacterized protein n=1 Tax=Protopolystoma xenopodis TaxID=117903 RepID=A0A3S5CDP9_9PLAT|nr:unnamed protein product [Protopolystoma xenopodis]
MPSGQTTSDAMECLQPVLWSRRLDAHQHRQRGMSQSDASTTLLLAGVRRGDK